MTDAILERVKTQRAATLIAEGHTTETLARHIAEVESERYELASRIKELTPQHGGWAGLAARRERGETVMQRNGVDLVHGRIIARDALADYAAIMIESNQAYQLSPFRSDYDELNKAIDADIISKAELMAYAIEKWLDDEKLEAQNRADEIDREIWRADSEDVE
ncbi:hypothetical protein FHT44_005070 [Mycolicibacterium sp. BK634]|uniref:hypothetical protein n=1 Tax=Mycolicibacterium sp. BK634 TaxID=2587099 RepID=UPI00161C4106|nr:hypothetical protein [Mycolicibacterium sp. BK634]MBB3752558.1 hypothetical protein [Mycolicibacterium sp. BK634]